MRITGTGKIQVQGGPKNGSFLYALTLTNIKRFLKLFHCQNQEKICNNTITKDPTMPQELTVCHSVSLIAPLVRGVARLNAPSSSTFDVKTVGCDSYFRQ